MNGDLRKRWEEIEAAMAEEEVEVAGETEAETEADHEPEYGGSEMPPAEEADELTEGTSGEGEEGEGGEASVGEVEAELPPGAAPTPQEVEGFESEEGLIAEQQAEAAEALERVFGRDDRVRVWNTRAYPWRTICHLDITTRTGRRGGCTGSFIGPRVVLTAGHCMYMHAQGGWVRSIRVTPGASGRAAPFGSVLATSFISVKGWTQKRKSSHDYGVIVLPRSQPLGNRVGWMGIANLSFFSLLGLRVNSSGYPGDKPYKTQWWNSNRILAVTGRRFYYRIDTYGGQSGSPVWRYKNGKRHIVGIHTTGSSVWNGATRIVRPVFNNLVNWKKL